MPAYPGGIYGENSVAISQITTGDPNTVNDSKAKAPIGGKIRWNNQVWRYVKYKATITAVAGAPAYAQTFTPGATASAAPVVTVSGAHADSVAGLQVFGVFGQFTTAPTDGYFIYVLVGGVGPVVSTGVAAVGDVLIGSATDSQFAKISDGGTLTNIPAARVVGASSAGLCPALLMNMDW